MAKNSPSKSHRKGIALIELTEMFPTEEAATQWFERVGWEEGRHCPKCGSAYTKPVPNAKPMPYWCKVCRSNFSLRTGTSMARSNIPLRKWAIAIYLCLTSLKSVSSMKLHRDFGISQRAAWFMLHRIREAWGDDGDDEPFDGPVEVDETYFGGKRRNMSNAKREGLTGTGRGAVGKMAVVGMKDWDTNQVRAEVITVTNAETLHDFVEETLGKTRPRIQTKRQPTGALIGTINRSSTPSVNMLGGRRTPMASRAYGRCSSGRTLARSTRSARSIWTATSGSFWQAQLAELRHACADAGHCRPVRRSQPSPSRLDRRQRVSERRPVAVPFCETVPWPASPGSLPSSALPGQVRERL